MIQSPTPAIDARHLVKTFGRLRALDDVSFTVTPQMVYCILGPNGAGKTTLLRILTTVSNPDKGEVFINGSNIQSHCLEVRQQIGVVAQENHFDRYLSIWHNLSMHAQMHGMPRKVYEPRIRELLEQVHLYDRRSSLPDELSGGMQRRIALIRALIHSPRLLFLDEPTTGLDPEARVDLWHTIEALKQSITVILTTHYMEEADRLSDTILMLNHGQIVKIGSPRELKQDISPVNKYELVFKTPQAKAYGQILESRILENRQKGLPLLLNSVKPVDDFRLELQVASPEALKSVLDWVNPADLLRLGQVEADLEDVFLSLAGIPKQATGSEAR